VLSLPDDAGRKGTGRPLVAHGTSAFSMWWSGMPLGAPLDYTAPSMNQCYFRC
jgi:hypothetical protein